MLRENFDVAVIGGGAAGLAAAIKAKETGVKKVLILDRNDEIGGILPQCIHTGFGLHLFRENLTGPEYIQRFVKKARDLQIDFRLETTVLRFTHDKKILAVNSKDGLLNLKSQAIVLAMGCRERTRGALHIPGTRPAGIYTAGTAQRLMDVEGYLPGREVVILGSGDVGLIMARRLAMEGVKVKAVVERMPYPGGLTRNVVQCLEDFDIPLLLERTVTNIHGKDRVEAVTISKVDAEGNPIRGTEEEIACDTLLLSVGLIPENELSEEAGVVLDEKAGGPLVNEHMETSIPGIFACGNVVTVYDLVDHVSLMGELAGESAAKYIRNELNRSTRRIRLRPGDNVKLVVPQIISEKPAIPVTFFIRVEKPMKDVEVEIGNLKFFKRAVSPPEMIAIKLPIEKIDELEKRPELRVNIRKV